MELMKRLFREEEGQGMTEYVLIIALIALAAVVVMGLFGDEINNIFQSTTNELQNANPNN